MKYVKVVERDGANEREVFSSPFDKLILMTDEHIGIVGINDINKFVDMVKNMIENYVVKDMGFDDDRVPSSDELTDIAIICGVIGANIASLSIGPLADAMLATGDDGVPKRKLEAMSKAADDMLNAMSSLDDVTDGMFIGTREKVLSDMIMMELEDIEADREKTDSDED